MQKPTPRLTLLTDFGTADGYVGAMKAVIADIAPGAMIDDISHDIAPGDLEAAAWALGAYWRRYPEGTVHVVVVDPGVGTKRDALAIEADGRILVGPDNGVLSWALREASRTGTMRSIDRPAEDHVSATFHGRDVFAPAAARLAAGESPGGIGHEVRGIVRLPWPEPVQHARGVDGVVVHVDRFGNLVTNVPADRVSGDVVVKVGIMEIDVRRTYSDALPGELVAHVGSRGLLEIAVRDGRAVERIGGKGHAVRCLRAE